MAMCVMAVVGVAPCQCFSPGENQTTSPGRISSKGPPFALNPAAASRHDERLTERMRVPGSPRALPVPWRAVEHPCEAAFDKYRRLDLISEQPAKLDAPLFVVLFLEDLFRAGELLVTSHLVYGCTEVL